VPGLSQAKSGLTSLAARRANEPGLEIRQPNIIGPSGNARRCAARGANGRKKIGPAQSGTDPSQGGMKRTIKPQVPMATQQLHAEADTNLTRC